MENDIIKNLATQFKLTEIDVGDFKKMKVGPMTFFLKCYDAEGLFKVSYLKGKALFGLMKMTTIVLTSNTKDIPIISYDRIKAGKKDVCLMEFYDTCRKRPSYEDLLKIKKEFTTYPRYEIKPAFSDEIKLEPSFSVYSKHGNHFDLLLNDYFTEIETIINEAENIPEDEKREANKKYVDGLLMNGGTSTDMFVKKIGKEKTEKLFRKFVFFVEKEEK